MANCYFCAAHIRSGEGFRRKVLVNESARIYFTRRGGGSYGQSYALRTLCQSCTVELDQKNKSFAWRFPVSVLIALISTIIAVRSRDSLEGIAFLFLLVGGPGFIAFLLLGLLGVQGHSQDDPIGSAEDISPAYTHKYEDQQAEAGSKIIDEIIKVAKGIEQCGISFYGCHDLDRSPDNFETLVNTVISELSPALFSNVEEWGAAVHVTSMQKYLTRFQEATNPLRLDRLLKIFPQAPDEPLEDYTARCMSVTEMALSILNQDESA